MTPKRILYLGAQSGTCLDRARAYQRLGHAVTHLDPRKLLPSTPWTERITWRLGGHWFAPLLQRQLSVQLQGQQFDLCHVDCGEWVTPATIALLKRHAQKVINYCIDDPTGPRDGRRFAAYRQALPDYDLVVVMRDLNVVEARNLGAKNIFRVFMSADEQSHAPRPLTEVDLKRWRADVLFLGTWMPERGPFMLELVRAGVPLTIQGAHWNKAPEWSELSAYWRGGPIGGDDYAKAIQCARINLGLLSKGNRDMHTTRSMEISALGALLCAERTAEHQALYCEGIEAIFWENAQECAAICIELLKQEAKLMSLAQGGHQRYLASAHSNQKMLSNVLQQLEAVS